MKLTHPNFILGIISFILLFIGIGLKANSYRFSDIVLITAVVIGGIHWVWGIIDAFGNHDIGAQSRKFWIMLVIIIPAVGSMLYYLMGTRQVKV